VLFVLLCGKLGSVYTEESSQQLTPLSEQRADPPALSLNEQVRLSPSPEEREWWRPWVDVTKALVIWGTSFFLLLVIPLISAIPYMVYRLVTVGGSSQGLLADKTLIFFTVLGILPAHLLTLVITWTIVSEGGRRPFWNSIAFAWPERTNPTITTILSVLMALILVGFAFLVTLIYGERKTDLDLLIESSNYTRVAMAFMAVATAPLVEEVIYRGVLYGALEKAAGVGIAIALVSLLFAGVHVYQYRNNVAVILVITLLSVVLTVARAYTGKMLPSFIIHFVFNGIQSVFIVLGGFIDTDALK
jgi:membrane protease YdiL (CAAX protease family)